MNAYWEFKRFTNNYVVRNLDKVPFELTIYFSLTQLKPLFHRYLLIISTKSAVNQIVFQGCIRVFCWRVKLPGFYISQLSNSAAKKCMSAYFEWLRLMNCSWNNETGLMKRSRWIWHILSLCQALSARQALVSQMTQALFCR